MTPWTMKEMNLAVRGGPSELDLILALFKGEEVKFTLITENLSIGRVSATITSVAAETNRGIGSWFLQGKLFWKDSWGLSRYFHSFSGFYDMKSRQGSFVVKTVVRLEVNSILLISRLYDEAGHWRLAENLELPLVNGLREMPR